MAAVATAINAAMKLLASMGTEDSSFKQDLKNLKEALEKIEVALDDATGRDMEYADDSRWPVELRNVCYDIQDMLDPSMFQYRQQCGRLITCGIPAKVLFETLHTPNVLPYMITVEGIKKRLDTIVNDKHIDISDIIIGNEMVMEEEIVSDESEIIGRENDKNDIVEMILRKNDSKELFGIPIYGKAGLGKTTVAKLIFDDKRVMEHFHVQAWVDVSSNFDLINVAKLLIGSIEHSDQIKLQFLENCRMVFEELVSEKRCLIVLDDVWTINTDRWEMFNDMLKCSSKGSIIIVTTRNEEVAKVITGDNSQNIVPLKTLPLTDCQQLFQNKASEQAVNVGTDDTNGDSTLDNIGNEIAVNCEGLPLIANVLGTMLCFQNNKKFWLFANKMLKKNRAFLIEDNISFLLKLKYQLLPPHLKPCFAYCSIFPKGYQIDVNKLVHHWISLNFIRSTQHDYMKLEGIGKGYLNNLVSMSFLQFEDKKSKVVMENHMYDIAQQVASNHDIKPFGKVNYRITNAYPYHYVSLNEVEEAFKFGEFARQNRKVRAIYLSSKFKSSLSDKSFSQLLRLRVLDVEGECIHLPKSIKKLKQLRCFSASDIAVFSKIFGVPDQQFLNSKNFKFGGATLDISQTFSNFQRLQYLKLPKCSNPVTFPQSMLNFENLLHLELNGCSELIELPDCFGTDLKHLQYLNLSNCVQLVTLNKSITNLKTLLYLSLSGCSKLKELPDQLGNLSALQNLDLRLCYRLKELPKSMNKLIHLQYLDLHECSQLEELSSHFDSLTELLHLNLSNCNFVALPESISSLKKLLNLDISFCVNLINLQYISSLENLNRLTVFRGQVHNLPWPLEHLKKLEHIVSMDRSPLFSSSMTEIERFTKLKTLRLSLDFSVKKKDIGGEESCDIVGLKNLNMLDGDLTLRGLENVKKPEDARSANLKEKHKVRRLELVWNGQQERRKYGVIENLEPSLKLRNLTISGYGGVKLPRWLTRGKNKLHYLKLKNTSVEKCFFGESVHALYLEDMQNLSKVSIKRSSNPAHLKTLWIENCPKLSELTLIDSVTTLKLKGDFEPLFSSPGCVKMAQSSSVQEIEISNYERLTELPEWFGDFPKLKRLHIKDCTGIKSLPNSLIWHTGLESLTIKGCGKDIEEQCLYAPGKDWSKIANISNLVINSSRYSHGLLKNKVGEKENTTMSSQC